MDGRGLSWKIIISSIPVIVATYISCTSISDNRNFLEDVLCGMVLGAMTAWFFYRLYFPSVFDTKNGGRAYPPRRFGIPYIYGIDATCYPFEQELALFNETKAPSEFAITASIPNSIPINNNTNNTQAKDVSLIPQKINDNHIHLPHFVYHRDHDYKFNRKHDHDFSYDHDHTQHHRYNTDNKNYTTDCQSEFTPGSQSQYKFSNTKEDSLQAQSVAGANEAIYGYEPSYPNIHRHYHGHTSTHLDNMKQFQDQAQNLSHTLQPQSYSRQVSKPLTAVPNVTINIRKHKGNPHDFMAGQSSISVIPSSTSNNRSDPEINAGSQIPRRTPSPSSLL